MYVNKPVSTIFHAYFIFPILARSGQTTDPKNTKLRYRRIKISTTTHEQRWYAIVSARARIIQFIYMILGLPDRSEDYTPVMVKTQGATISDLAKRWTLVQVPLGACIAARGGSTCCVLCGIVQPGLPTFYVDFHRCNNPWTGDSRQFNAHPRSGWSGDWSERQISRPTLAWWAQVIFWHVPQNGLIFVCFSGDRQTRAWIIVDTGLYVLLRLLIWYFFCDPTYVPIKRANG